MVLYKIIHKIFYDNDVALGKRSKCNSTQCVCMHSGTPMSSEYWWFVWHMSKEQMKLNTGFQDSRRILCAPLLLSHPAKHYWKRWVVCHLETLSFVFPQT